MDTDILKGTGVVTGDKKESLEIAVSTFGI